MERNCTRKGRQMFLLRDLVMYPKHCREDQQQVCSFHITDFRRGPLAGRNLHCLDHSSYCWWENGENLSKLEKQKIIVTWPSDSIYPSFPGTATVLQTSTLFALAWVYENNIDVITAIRYSLARICCDPSFREEQVLWFKCAPGFAITEQGRMFSFPK